MPLAFTRHARVAVWIDPVERRLVSTPATQRVPTRWSPRW